MSYYSDNPARDYDRYDADREEALSKYPICSECDERIQDDYCYEIDGEIICEDCITRYRRDVDSLID